MDKMKFIVVLFLTSLILKCSNCFCNEFILHQVLSLLYVILKKFKVFIALDSFFPKLNILSYEIIIANLL